MMAPYDENMEAEGHFEAVDSDDMNSMAEHFKVAPTHEALLPLMEEWHGHPGVIVDGVLGYMSTYNPLSKWDYWRIGGRWAGQFISTDPDAYMEPLGWEWKPEYNDGEVHELEPGQCDQSRKRFIDWDAMGAKQIAERRKWWAEAQEKIAAGESQSVVFRYGLNDINETEDEYVRRGMGFSCFAVLDADGWHEKGRMGWWGIVSDETDTWPDQFKALVDAADGDDWFTICDVHI